MICGQRAGASSGSGGVNQWLHYWAPTPDSVVNALQHRSGLKAGSVLPFVPPDYDQASLDATAAG